MKYRNFFLIILIIILILVIYKCGVEEEKNDKEIPVEEENDYRLSAWTVYWHSEGVISEFELLEETLSDIIYFAAYFNKEEKLFIPEDLLKIYQEMKDRNITFENSYLSIVNDLVIEEGDASLKDTQLLDRLFKDDQSMEDHIKEIIILAKEYGYEGIEIDYEGIKDDKDLWNRYLVFIEKLYKKLEAYDLQLRVVLEPSIPVEVLELPMGPTYVLMCYNLYGSHSEAGPKADLEFLDQLMRKADYIPNVSFALATGGFDWSKKGVVSLTEEEANRLLNTYANVTTIRDKSQVLSFSYEDETGMSHEVWYADGETMVAWMDYISDKGYNDFSIWRLNGNMEESLEQILHFFKNKFLTDED